MKRLSSLMILLFATLCLTACGSGEDPHEAAVEDMLNVMDEFDNVLASVTDAESAKEIGPKLDEIREQMDALIKEMRELEAPSDEKVKELQEKFKPRMDEMKTQMTDQMARLTQIGPEVMVSVMEQMDKLAPKEEMPEWMSKFK